MSSKGNCANCVFIEPNRPENFFHKVPASSRLHNCLFLVIINLERKKDIFETDEIKPRFKFGSISFCVI